MENLYFLIIPIIAIVIVVLVSFFSKKAIVKRKLKNTPSKKIKDFKNGDIAKVVGSVDCIKEPLIAPLTNRKCAYYYIKVEKKVSTGKSTSWKKIIEEDVSENFIIRDDTGTAVVNVDNIKSYLVIDAKYRSGFFDDATENLEKYLNKHSYESKGFMGLNKTIRYREAVLEIGEQIAVVGAGHWNESSKDIKTLEIIDYAENPVYLSDDPVTLKFVEEKVSTKIKESNFQSFRNPSKQKKQKKRSRYRKEYR